MGWNGIVKIRNPQIYMFRKGKNSIKGKQQIRTTLQVYDKYRILYKISSSRYLVNINVTLMLITHLWIPIFSLGSYRLPIGGNYAKMGPAAAQISCTIIQPGP